MANYTIIGGDGKQYGPITDAELRKWIAEGRLNGQSLAKAESDAEFRTLSTFPEFADAFGPTAPEAAPAYAPVDWSQRDYELDIGGCVSRGWNVFKSNLGILLGAFVLYFIVLAVAGGCLNGGMAAFIPPAMMTNTVFKIFFSIFVQAVLALVAGPLTGGYYYLFLQATRGRTANIGDLFIGFQKAYVQLFLGYFTITFIAGLCTIPLTVFEGARFEPLLAQMRQGSTPDQFQSLLPQFGTAFVGVLPVFLICLVPMTYLMVSLQFTVPLIIDKGMDFGTAIKTSWRLVNKHWFTVFGLAVVIGLVSIAGALACCIGILFTIPIGAAALMQGYETIFGESRAA